MMRLAKVVAVFMFTFGWFVLVSPEMASAQCYGAVAAPYAPQPAVTYYPEVRGLIFPRVVYRPAVANPVALLAAPVTTYYAPARYYAPAPVTAYCAPAMYSSPTTAYYAPAPVTTRHVSPIFGY